MVFLQVCIIQNSILVVQCNSDLIINNNAFFASTKSNEVQYCRAIINKPKKNALFFQIIIMSKIAYLLFIGLIATGCSKDKVLEPTDAQLFEMAQNTSNTTWYKLSDALLGKSAGSGHPQEFLRTRFNDIAATQLETNGKVIVGAIFPEGSLIVKELFENENDLARYAILYKSSQHEYADDNGWVWGYINADRSVAVSASTKGSSCINCHSQSENIDGTLMNKFFP